ncbi:MAG: helical backbone metal receptor [Oscillospiraceae bacterium]
MKRFFAVFSALILVISLSSCKEVSGEGAPVVTVAEDYPVGVSQLMFEKAPEKVISLSPAVTEIIYELGFGNVVIGRSSYCDYPEEVLKRTDVGSSANPNIDEIIKLAPELVISQSPIAKKDISKFETSNIRVLILNTPQNLTELRQSYLDMAKLFGGGKNAETIADNQMKPLYEKMNSVQKQGSFAYLTTYDLSVATADTLAGDILSSIGENVAATAPNHVIAKEELIAKQPEILFTALPMNYLKFDADIQAMPAIVNKKVFSIDNSSFERPTVRRLIETFDAVLANFAPPKDVTTAAE